MRYELGLSLKHQLELKLHPQLIMNLQLLQVTTLDLEALVRQELENNPALEQSDDAPESGDEAPAADDAGEPTEPVAESDAGTDAEAGEVPEPPVVGESEDTKVDESPLGDYTIDELFPDEAYLPGYNAGGTPDSEVDAVELAAGPGPGLREAAMPQLRNALSEEDAKVAELIIESLDADGFLPTTVDEFAQLHDVEMQRVKDILYVIQRIDPGGIGCRTRQEAFLVQLELHGCRPDSLECRIVADHWKLLLQSNVPKIARLCGVAEEQVREAIETILTLEPRPARQYDGGTTEYISPDFSVVWQGDEPVPIFHRDSLPRLRLARKYQDMLRSPKAYGKEQVAFARERLNRAVMFLKGIESRRHLLDSLMKHIVREQRDFFVSGPQHLRPATMRDAATALQVHPSTVSRAVAGKYAETDYGIFPLKHFFKAGAGDKSRASIKRKIELIIEKENKKEPLSDDEIGAKLKEEAISISRRTVAKYRNELHIPGRNQRREY